MNPWLPEEGASGSNAGPGAATAAGLVAFSIGSETGGSIVSPAMRCGITGLRPTFGRVSRTGAMTLCWSLDKLGPMTRSVEDALLVLNAITGHDPADSGSLPSHLDFDSTAPVRGLRVGYLPAWMKEAPATDVDRAALETVRRLGMIPTEVTLPDLPYGSLTLILLAEAAASFEDLTLSGGLNQPKVQTPDAWPSVFRQARFLSAVDYVQTDRLRRQVALERTGRPSEPLCAFPKSRPASSTMSISCSSPPCATKCSIFRTSPDTRLSPSAPVSSKSPKPAATGPPTRPTPSPNSRPRAASPTASPSSAGSSTKAPSERPASPSKKPSENPKGF